MLGRMEWAQADMVGAVGTVRCGCNKSSIPQKPERFQSQECQWLRLSESWVLIITPTWDVIAACTSPGLLKKLRWFEPLSPSPLTKTQRFGGLGGALPALLSTCASPERTFTLLPTPPGSCMICFPYSGHQKCWVPQEIPISSPPEILHSLAQRSQHAASAYLWWGIAVVLRAAPENLDCCWHLHSLTRYLTHSLQAFPVKILKPVEVF